MAFENTVLVRGDQGYRISPEIKAFTLRDLGFTLNNAGAFVQTNMLEPEKGFSASRKLKITFTKDLTAFKISLLSGNEAINIDIFSNPKDKVLVEQYRFFMKQLIDRKVIETIS